MPLQQVLEDNTLVISWFAVPGGLECLLCFQSDEYANILQAAKRAFESLIYLVSIAGRIHSATARNSPCQLVPVGKSVVSLPSHASLACPALLVTDLTARKNDCSGYLDSNMWVKLSDKGTNSTSCVRETVSNNSVHGGAQCRS